ncbi:hypothetical protein M9458_033276, partial [Cirrhinus mrigala]
FKLTHATPRCEGGISGECGGGLPGSGVLSASRMNSAIVVFLDSIDKANEVVEHGIIVKGELIPVVPLSLPAKKVTISNVPPFVSDLILTQALSRYGKLVSPIKKIPINCSSPLLKHIVSFRWFAYMIINDDADLDVSLNFRTDDFDYVVFVTTAKMKCFSCGTFGHLMRNCPEIIAEKERNVGGRSESGDLAGVSGEAEGAPPGEGSVAAAAATPPPASSSETVEGVIAPTHAETRSDEGRKDVDNVTWGKTGDGQADRVSENSAEHFQEMCEIAKCCGREEEQAIFKTPQKRKKSNEVPDAKVSKKIEMHDDEDLETKSDAESSDSSVTVSQNEFIGRSYELDDIKLFLRSTKNKRGVRVQEYFPDLKQFVDKARSLMAEGSFTNKEV